MKGHHLFFIAGEQSGDLHGSRLLKQFKALNPTIRFSGVGGSAMRASGLHCIAKSEDFEIMGFTAVLKNLPTIVKQFKTVRSAILSSAPEVVVLIDYPGFNLRMAQSLRSNGYEGRIVQYISPTFWAWGKTRLKKMEKHLDMLLTIYPFEAELLKDSSLDCRYVGNPIWETIHHHRYHNEWNTLLGIRSTDSLIAIFPGSRTSEVSHHLPAFLQTALILKSRNPSYRFAISCASVELMSDIQKMISETPLRINRDIYLIPKNYRYELMRDCRTALAKCGSVALELALHGKPTLITYHASLINRLIAKHVIRLDLEFFSMPNILLKKQVFPELIKESPSPQHLAQAIIEIDEEGDLRNQCLKGCSEINQLLAGRSPSEHGARAIMEYLRR